MHETPAKGQGEPPEMTQPTLAAGTVFGQYTIARLIGAGGMGAVYEATHRALEKRVALKTLHPNVATNAGIMARFVREGQLAARIRHPNVVDVSDVGIENGVPYLVMEFMEGEDLGDLIHRRGQLPIERTADIMLAVCAAVSAAHEESVVHRDLKPDNVFLAAGRDGNIQPKVVDFGISKALDANEALALTSTTAMLGTPYYMSPEQARGAKHVDARSDQYSVGVILYECVTGARPFQADSLFALIHDIVEARYNPPRVRRPDIPPEFEAVILRAMRRQPEDRFPSVLALGRMLLPFASPIARGQWEKTFGTADVGPRSVPPDGTTMPDGTDTRLTTRVTTPSRGGGDVNTLVANSVDVTSVSAPRTSRPARALTIAGASIALVGLLGAAAWWMAQPHSSVATTTTHAATAGPSPALVVAPTPVAPSSPASAPVALSVPIAPVVAPVPVLAATPPVAPDAEHREQIDPTTAVGPRHGHGSSTTSHPTGTHHGSGATTPGGAAGNYQVD